MLFFKMPGGTGVGPGRGARESGGVRSFVRSFVGVPSNILQNFGAWRQENVDSYTFWPQNPKMLDGFLECAAVEGGGLVRGYHPTFFAILGPGGQKMMTVPRFGSIILKRLMVF